jgi:hypothetical protein
MFALRNESLPEIWAHRSAVDQSAHGGFVLKRHVLLTGVAASLVACLAGCDDTSKTPTLGDVTTTAQLPTAPTSAAPTSLTQPSESSTSAPSAADSPRLSAVPSSVPVPSVTATSTAATSGGTTSAPTSVREPAALVPSLAGKADFGHAVAVVATRGAPCLSVDRLVELSGAAAAAWVAKHPNDAAVNDLGVIADEDGPSLVCVPLSSKPTIRLSANPHDQGFRLQVGTLDQLRHVLADSEYGRGAPTWFADAFFYRWDYDAKGAVDRVTAFWTP